jgi:hypothetical protein
MPDIDIEISAGPIRAIPVLTTVTGGIVLGGESWLAGWSLMETTGAAVASATITTGGNVVGVVSLLAGGSQTATLPDLGIYMREDITLNVLAGSMRGAIYAKYYKPGDDTT